MRMKGYSSKLYSVACLSLMLSICLFRSSFLCRTSYSRAETFKWHEGTDICFRYLIVAGVFSAKAFLTRPLALLPREQMGEGRLFWLILERSLPLGCCEDLLPQVLSPTWCGRSGPQLVFSPFLSAFRGRKERTGTLNVMCILPFLYPLSPSQILATGLGLYTF